jgi:hypothetical protein
MFRGEAVDDPRVPIVEIPAQVVEQDTGVPASGPNWRYANREPLTSTPLVGVAICFRRRREQLHTGPAGRHWSMTAACATIGSMFAVRLVARLHVDLQRVVSAACLSW